MADSYRLAVLKRLTQVLEATVVTPIAGVTLPDTLAGLVFRGRSIYGDSDPKTMLSILESPKQFNALFSADDTVRKEDWQLLLQGWSVDSKVNPTDNLYSLVEDVEKQLDRITAGEGRNHKYPEDYLLADSNGEPLITSFKPGAPVVSPAREGVSSKAFFYIPLQMGLCRIQR